MRSIAPYFVYLFLTINFSIAQNFKEDSLKTGSYAKYPPLDIDISYHSEWTKTHYPQRIRAFMNDPLTANEIVFLGNSITEQAGDWNEKFGTATIRNRGISGDVTEGIIARLGEIYDAKPIAVFLLIGINDLYLGKSPEFVATKINEIAQLIKKYTPETTIYVQTVLPTANADIKPKIDAVNTLIFENESVHPYQVVDLHGSFANDQGLIISSYTNDGVHLTKEGYLNWVTFEKNLITLLTSKSLKD